MNKALELVTGDFPRTPSLLFSGWIVSLVIADLLATLGFISEQPSDENNTDKEVVIHFVQFQSIALNNFTIMVGTQYKANDGSDPEKQWCYADKLASGGSHRINISLATKDSNQAVTYLSISQTSAKKLGLSPREVKGLAKTHCNFL